MEVGCKYYRNYTLDILDAMDYSEKKCHPGDKDGYGLRTVKPTIARLF